MDAGVSGVISIVEEEDDGTLDEPVLTTLVRIEVVTSLTYEHLLLYLLNCHRSV